MSYALPNNQPSWKRFCFFFLLLSSIMISLIYINYGKLFYPVNMSTACVVSKLAEVMGYESDYGVKEIRSRPRVILNVGGYQAIVILECSAIFTVVLLSAFIIAYPAKIEKKLKGLGWGLLVIISLNYFRILILMLLGANGYTTFVTYGHDILMKLFPGVVIIVALLWLRSIDVNKHDWPLEFGLRFIGWASIISILWVLILNNVFGISKGIFFDTLPFVLFIALVFSSKRINLKKNYKAILVCSAGLLTTFLILKYWQSVYVYYARGPLSIKQLLFFVYGHSYRYILPFALYWYLTKGELFINRNVRGEILFTCPECGKENLKNLEAHMAVKHNIIKK